MPVFLFPFFLFFSLFSSLLALSHMPGASGVGPMISPVYAPLPVAAGVGPKVPQANLQEALQHRRLPRRRGFYLYIAHDSRADADHE